MVFPVTVENAVDTGVGVHADILPLGHLLPSSGPINNRGSRGGDRARLSLPLGGVSASRRGMQGGKGSTTGKNKDKVCIPGDPAKGRRV